MEDSRHWEGRGYAICPLFTFPNGRQQDKANVSFCNKAGWGRKRGLDNGYNSVTSTATFQRMVIKLSPYLCSFHFYVSGFLSVLSYEKFKPPFSVKKH